VAHRISPREAALVVLSHCGRRRPPGASASQHRPTLDVATQRNYANPVRVAWDEAKIDEKGNTA
jgi:hypothetical protein